MIQYYKGVKNTLPKIERYNKIKIQMKEEKKSRLEKIKKSQKILKSKDEIQQSTFD